MSWRDYHHRQCPECEIDVEPRESQLVAKSDSLLLRYLCGSCGFMFFRQVPRYKLIDMLELGAGNDVLPYRDPDFSPEFRALVERRRLLGIGDTGFSEHNPDFPDVDPRTGDERETTEGPARMIS